MTRLAWLAAVLAAMLALGALAVQSPRTEGADAEADVFSAARAMVDVRALAREPRPIGSPGHAAAEAWLTARMTELGLSPEVQTGPLSPRSVRLLERGWGVEAGPDLMVRNLVGVLPGRDPTAPAVLLMAHYDGVPDSPAAADDAAGVAAILEAVRALRARGRLPAERDLIVLFTDAEETGLDGARVFFGGHPLRDRIGFVINLEARGGGGRALMFETGRGDAASVDLFAQTASRVSGGVSGNSLAVFIYSAMPNGTDFTIARDRGLPGLNFAFIGRADQYHAAASTPDALDQGALQHLGEQALEGAEALLHGPDVASAGPNAVFSDLFGLVVLRHPPAWGWGVLGLALVLAGVAAWRLRIRPVELGRGALDGLWFLAAAFVLTHLTRVAAGPLGSRVESAETYYLLLRRLPWIEAGAALAVLAAGLATLAGREMLRPRHRRMTAAAVGVVVLIIMAVTGFSLPVAVALGLLLVLTWIPDLAARTVWGGAMGVLALVLGLGAVAQATAPQAAFVFLWPGLLAAAAALAAVLIDPALKRPQALAALAVPAALAGGWLAALAHPAFLGVGADLPGVLAVVCLPVLAMILPLAPEARPHRALWTTALGLLLLGVAVSAWV